MSDCQATLVTPPVAEPVDQAEVKKHLRVTDSADDDQIDALIISERQTAENFCNRAFLTQTWKLFLDDFPDVSICNPYGSIWLPRPPLQSVTHVKYYNTSGTLTTLTVNTDYMVDNDNAELHGRVYLPYNISWPVVQARAKAVEIQFLCGWKGVDPEAAPTAFWETGLPVSIGEALKLRIQVKYDRDQLDVQTIDALNEAAENLLMQHRIVELP